MARTLHRIAGFPVSTMDSGVFYPNGKQSRGWIGNNKKRG